MTRIDTCDSHQLKRQATWLRGKMLVLVTCHGSYTFSHMTYRPKNHYTFSPTLISHVAAAD
jgi:hypothetical protein